MRGIVHKCLLRADVISTALCAGVCLGDLLLDTRRTHKHLPLQLNRPSPGRAVVHVPCSHSARSSQLADWLDVSRRRSLGCRRSLRSPILHRAIVARASTLEALVKRSLKSCQQCHTLPTDKFVLGNAFNGWVLCAVTLNRLLERSCSRTAALSGSQVACDRSEERWTSLDAQNELAGTWKAVG